MDVVDAIGNVPIGDNGPMPGEAPVTPIMMKKVTIVLGNQTIPARMRVGGLAAPLVIGR